MAEMWRLFIAIELPPDVLSTLVETQTRLKQQLLPRTVRWVKPQGIHLTLKFLGDVPAIRRDTLQDALTQAAQGFSAFDLAAGGLGCFPNTKRPRVVWVGVHEDGGILWALRDAVETHIAPLGYPTENRPFNPHLTLGRVRREAERKDVLKLGTLVANSPSGPPHPWRVTGVGLIRSELKPTGAVYTRHFHVPLSHPDSTSPGAT